MKLTDEIEKLQEKNEGKIILMKSGIFFIAIKLKWKKDYITLIL